MQGRPGCTEYSSHSAGRWLPGGTAYKAIIDKPPKPTMGEATMCLSVTCTLCSAEVVCAAHHRHAAHASRLLAVLRTWRSAPDSMTSHDFGASSINRPPPFPCTWVGTTTTTGGGNTATATSALQTRRVHDRPTDRLADQPISSAQDGLPSASQHGREPAGRPSTAVSRT